MCTRMSSPRGIQRNGRFSVALENLSSNIVVSCSNPVFRSLRETAWHKCKTISGLRNTHGSLQNEAKQKSWICYRSDPGTDVLLKRFPFKTCAHSKDWKAFRGTGRGHLCKKYFQHVSTPCATTRKYDETNTKLTKALPQHCSMLGLQSASANYGIFKTNVRRHWRRKYKIGPRKVPVNEGGVCMRAGIAKAWQNRSCSRVRLVVPWKLKCLACTGFPFTCHDHIDQAMLTKART